MKLPHEMAIESGDFITREGEPGAALGALLRTSPPAKSADPEAADLIGEPGDGAEIDADEEEESDEGDATKSTDDPAAAPWTDDEITAAATDFSADAVRQAIAGRTPEMQRLLRARQVEEGADDD